MIKEGIFRNFEALKRRRHNNLEPPILYSAKKASRGFKIKRDALNKAVDEYLEKNQITKLESKL